jgi:outer membrane protein assembly factor BamB
MCLIAVSPYLGCAATADWPQWGGPNRDFTVATVGLADQWPEGGPRKIWHRELGDGYSSILFSDGVLYTMYRKTRLEEEEAIVALDASSGEIIWEHKYPSPLTKPVEEWGHGPNATPLIVGKRLFAIGTNADVKCLDKKNGKVLWTRDLVQEGVAVPADGVGYIASPIAYKNTIILRVGNGRHRDPENQNTDRAPARPEVAVAKGQSILALDQATGRIIWKGLDFETGASSPMLINFAGQDQLVLYVKGGVIGVEPNKGELLWRYEIPERSTIMSPVWNGEDLLLWSSENEGGYGTAIKLTKEDGKTIPKEHWRSRKLRVAIGTPVPVGDYVFGSSGKLFVGISLSTGKRTWGKRGYETVSCVHGDGKVIILDENGQMTLASVTPAEFNVLSQCQITERYSYTPPTLVGTTLYVRDRKHIMALDIGKISGTTDGSES